MTSFSRVRRGSQTAKQLEKITVNWPNNRTNRGSFLKVNCTVEPLLTDTFLIRTPLYYGQFPLSQQNSNIFSSKKTSIIRTLSKGRFTRYNFVACDMVTTSQEHELFRVNQTYNLLAIVVYDTKNVLGF